MKVLMLSTDEALRDPESQVSRRMQKLAELTSHISIIVLSREYFYWEKDKIRVESTKSKNLLTFAIQLFRLGVKQKEVTFVTAQEESTALAGWLIARWLNVPLEIQAHTDVGSPYYGHGKSVEKARKIIARFLYPKAARVRAVSERVKKGLLTSGVRKERIYVLPVFIDVVKKIREKRDHAKVRFLYVGRLSREKNVSLILKAYASIRDQFPNTELAIVGDGPLAKNLKVLARDLGIYDSIYFKGWMNTSDLSSEYGKATVLVLSSYVEGYGVVIVEAFSHGVPVIMTDVGIAGEVAKHEKNALIVPIDDKDEFTHAMKRFLEDKNLRQQLKVGAEETPLPKSFEEYSRDLRNAWEGLGEHGKNIKKSL